MNIGNAIAPCGVLQPSKVDRLDAPRRLDEPNVGFGFDNSWGCTAEIHLVRRTTTQVPVLTRVLRKGLKKSSVALRLSPLSALTGSPSRGAGSGRRSWSDCETEC